MALFQVQNNYFLFQSIMGIIGSILSYEEQTRMEPHDSEATLYQEYSFLWYNMVMIYLPAHGRISSVFAAYAQPSKINLVRGYGAFPHRRCYARKQFVVPDKKGETVSRRDYR